MIDKEHQKKFIDVWEHGEYRRGSTAQRLVQRLLNWIPEGASINDYGCGTGRAEVEMHKARPSQKITMIDITETAVEPEAKIFPFIEADLSDLSAVPVADWGMCINCLMTVQKDKLGTILAEIRRTCRNLIVEVYDWQDVRLGREYTTVIMSRDEWGRKLSEFWPIVIFERDHGTDRRFIFICRGDE